jgi:5-methyltetrahydropteroyltriglutamate--homocysteine methyltransferase
MNMKRSAERILTTHVGSLPRPDDLMALYRDNPSDDKLQPQLRAAVDNIVRRQAEAGIDIVNDGELGKAMRSAMDFGAWWSYVYPRLAGFELSEEQAKKGRAAWTYGSKERKEFAEFYAAEASAAASAARQSGSSSAQLYGLRCTSAVKYIGHAAISATPGTWRQRFARAASKRLS